MGIPNFFTIFDIKKLGIPIFLKNIFRIPIFLRSKFKPGNSQIFSASNFLNSPLARLFFLFILKSKPQKMNVYVQMLIYVSTEGGALKYTVHTHKDSGHNYM